MPFRQEDLNGPSFNPVPTVVAKLLMVWVRTSEHGRKYGLGFCYTLVTACYFRNGDCKLLNYIRLSIARIS